MEGSAQAQPGTSSQVTADAGAVEGSAQAATSVRSSRELV